MKKVIIIDYALGNLRSVGKALEKAGAVAEISSEPDVIRGAKALILPGVGAFRHGMDNLEARGIMNPLMDSIKQGKPLLGICLGLQLLFAESEEHGSHPGMGIIPGRVRRLPESLKVPQMGWNQVRFTESGKRSAIFKGVQDEAFFYFVHSYYVEPEQKELIAGTTDYGIDFASAVVRDNIWALQFHPEKSGDAGLQILENWIEHAG
jgi:glutamine amidotransferase